MLAAIVAAGFSMFKSVLIANRGEIACRIARTAQPAAPRPPVSASASPRD